MILFIWIVVCNKVFCKKLWKLKELTCFQTFANLLIFFQVRLLVHLQIFSPMDCRETQIWQLYVRFAIKAILLVPSAQAMGWDLATAQERNLEMAKQVNTEIWFTNVCRWIRQYTCVYLYGKQYRWKDVIFDEIVFLSALEFCYL